jgi:hypothetical protein
MEEEIKVSALCTAYNYKEILCDVLDAVDK